MQPKNTRSPFTEVQWTKFTGWTLTAILCLLPVIFWFSIHSVSDFFSGNFTSLMLDLGRITGLIGMVMYALNLIYATRLRIFENLFGGLNRVYIAHHVLGGLALIFLCLHPLFLALRYATTSMREAAMLLIPHDLVPISALFDKAHELNFDVTQQWSIFLGIIAFWGLVVLMIFTFFIKLPYKVWLFSHKFLGFAFFLAGLHVFFISSDTSENGLLRYYILGLSALGLLAFIYRTLMPRVLVRTYKYYVDKVVVSGGSVTQLKMRPVKLAMHYKPGQFVL